MPSPEDVKASIHEAIRRISAWMVANDAGMLVENLAPGATPGELAACEKSLGFALPPQLALLWSIHGGQREEQNGFVGAMDLLGPQFSPSDLEDITMNLEGLREDPACWKEAGVSEEEALSDQWVPLAARGYADKLAVSVVSGRVFTCEKDFPPFHLVAGSVLEWIEAYRRRVEAGDYAVEEGFGDCYLARPDAMF